MTVSEILTNTTSENITLCLTANLFQLF